MWQLIFVIENRALGFIFVSVFRTRYWAAAILRHRICQPSVRVARQGGNLKFKKGSKPKFGVMSQINSKCLECEKL